MKLKSLKVNSFAGINPSSPVIIDFSNKWVSISGDNGVGKTSLINALLVACGQLSRENKNFVNNESGKIDIDFEFQGRDRCNYLVRCTKSKFELRYEGESLPEPMTKIKQLLGVVGVSPMDIKNKPISEIIKWISSYSNKNPDEWNLEYNRLKNNIKESQSARAQANKQVKAISERLKEEPLFINWEESEKKYKNQVDIKDISAMLDTAGKESDKLIKAEEKLKQLKDRSSSIKYQIQQLQNELSDVEKSISTGEKFVESNKDANKKYDEVKKQYYKAAADSVQYEKWQDIKVKKSELDEYETMSQKADSMEKKFLTDLDELRAEILPDIKNVELITEDTHRNGDVLKEGLYWKGRNVAQLSESEWWSIVIEIWRKYKVKIIAIDNYQSLGSMAVQILEKLHKDGAYIFTAEMNRATKTLEVSYE